MGLPASVSWAPGHRLVTASGAHQFSEASSGEGVHPAYIRLFYQGHLQFRSQTETTNPADASVAYRSYILELLRSLELTKDKDSEKEAAFVRDAFVVWGLISAIYFDGEDKDREGIWVGGRIGEWWRVNWGGQGVDGIVGEVDWWKQVAKVVAVGDRARGMELIKELVEVRGIDEEKEAVGKVLMGGGVDVQVTVNEAAVVVAEMLNECPGDDEGARLDGIWDAWQRRCAQWAQNLSDECKGEKIVLSVMSGDVDVLKQVCDDWQSLFVAYLMYVVGGGAYGDTLEYVSRSCAYAADVHGPPEHIAGGALTEAALGNPAECLIYLGSSVGSAWHAAHLASLMALSLEECRPLMNHFVALFATGLEWHPGLWRLAVDYLLAIQDTLTLTEFLSRVNISSTADPNADKVLRICQQQGFRDVEKFTYRRLATLALSNGSFSGAIYYRAKAGDVDEAIQLCHEVTSNAEFGGSTSKEADTLGQLPAAILASQNEKLASSVHWISTYVALQQAVREHRAKDIIRYGAQLLDGTDLPKRYWKGVLAVVCSAIDEAQIDMREAHGVTGLLSKLEVVDVSRAHVGDTAITDMRKTLVETFVRAILQ